MKQNKFVRSTETKEKADMTLCIYVQKRYTKFFFFESIAIGNV